MKFVMFYHSLVSDWNHGNAHFLRGIVSELLLRGHEVVVYEPRDGWSLQNLRSERGDDAVDGSQRVYPGLRSTFYDASDLDLEHALAGADVVIVHEWNDRDLVRRVGQHRKEGGQYQLFFHDTHHRAITAPAEMASYDLSSYDGVLAFGGVIRELYMQRCWTRRAWTWHEAADTRVFRPIAGRAREGDLVWVGNWGDDERSAELHEFLIGPVRRLGLSARVHGVRYPDYAKTVLREAGITYAGWLANYDVPEVLAHFALTVHIPRRPYVQALPGIPTIRVFEALACGMPLVCSPWTDSEHLFSPGKDYLIARHGQEMQQHLRALLHEPELARQLGAHGHKTILSRHTCAHRVDELMTIIAEAQAEPLQARRVRKLQPLVTTEISEGE